MNSDSQLIAFYKACPAGLPATPFPGARLRSAGREGGVPDQRRALR